MVWQVNVLDALSMGHVEYSQLDKYVHEGKTTEIGQSAQPASRNTAMPWVEPQDEQAAQLDKRKDQRHRDDDIGRPYNPSLEHDVNQREEVEVVGWLVVNGYCHERGVDGLVVETCRENYHQREPHHLMAAQELILDLSEEEATFFFSFFLLF